MHLSHMRRALYFLFVISAWSCGNGPIGSCPLTPFQFVVLDSQGNSLFKAADPDLVDIYYFRNGVAQSIKSDCPVTTCLRPTPSGSEYPFYYSSATPPLVSGKDKITDFYIKIGGDMDTINLIARVIPGGDDSCISIVDARYNSRAAIKTTIRSTIDIGPTYVFQKK